MAEFIVEWAVRSPSDRVLEPSCGEAAFLVPTIDRLGILGSGENIDRQVFGAELYEPSAKEACSSVHAATGLDLNDAIRVGDFFETRVGVDFPQVDACIGNPPYVRYQSFAGDARKRGREAALREGVAIDGLASSWAPFTVHAASFVGPGGRLGLVLPAELLSVNYAAPVRRYLLERFGCVRVVLFEERVFPGVQEEVVLLLAEGEGPCDRFDLVQVADLNGLCELDARPWGASPNHGKWTDLLLPNAVAEAVARIEGTGCFTELGEISSLSIGMVTGGNRFFCITDEERRTRKVPYRDLMKLLPPGSKNLRGLFYGDDDWTGARDAGSRVWLFYPSEPLGQRSRQYVRAGEDDGLSQAYKCRVRTPWYTVPLVPTPDLFLTYMASRGPRMITNPTALLFVNSVHGVYLNEDHKWLSDLMPLASLSTMTLLSAELVGRAYGGGLLKMEPSEAARLAVPSAKLVRSAEKTLREFAPHAEQLLRNGDFEQVVEGVDRILLRGTANVSERTLKALERGRQVLLGRRMKRSQT
jgi:adenine-specific DNA methylase